MSSFEFTTLVGTHPPREQCSLGRSVVRHSAAGEPLRETAWDAIKRFNYRLAQSLGRIVFFQTMNVEVVRPEAAERPGGYVLAPTHLSHLEPFCLGILIRRKVDWMARIEFFQWAVGWLLLYAVDAFPVDRFGTPVRAIRRAIARARAGRVVGIFPEGGVAVGAQSVCRGGGFKKGACVVAYRAGVPILPCVVLGTHRLNEIKPWLPFRRARLWVIYGTPIDPLADPVSRRQARDYLAAELQKQYQSLYGELRARYGIADGDIP